MSNAQTFLVTVSYRKNAIPGDHLYTFRARVPSGEYPEVEAIVQTVRTLLDLKDRFEVAIRSVHPVPQYYLMKEYAEVTIDNRPTTETPREDGPVPGKQPRKGEGNPAL